MIKRTDIEAREERELAPYAMRASRSLGRRHAEEEHELRTAFLRDRDRIIHSTAFRRLEYKTQVFANQEGDLYRTRLTHTLEVAQIARTAARILGLNEDLTEAVALAHDLGHTAFGHTGQDVLRDLMAAHGGFEHNRHGLRIVDLLERRYPEFPGLNLTCEVRGAILKYPEAGREEDREFSGVGEPLLETQVVDLADSIAYAHHDLDDGLRSGLLKAEELEASVELWHVAAAQARQLNPGLPVEDEDSLSRKLIIRSLIDMTVRDLVMQTLRTLEEARVASVSDVRSAGRRLVVQSPELGRQKAELHGFLHSNFYSHPEVLRMTGSAEQILSDLFETYCSDPGLLPPRWMGWIAHVGRERAVCDYIAGMTDRWACREHERLAGLKK